MTTSSDKVRLFVAVDVPTAEHLRLDEALASLRRSLSAGRWISPESRHVTLKFLGWTAAEVVPAVRATVEKAARAQRPAALRLDGLGAFPSVRRARVLWVGLFDPTGLLTGLAADLEAALEPVGFSQEQRQFTPHLTLARFKAPVRLPAELPEIAPSEPFRVDRVVLYRSRLHPQGARYEPLDRFPLGDHSG